MYSILRNARVFTGHEPVRFDVLVKDGVIISVGNDISVPSGAEVFDFSGFSDPVIFPGFSDVHVHLREPGFCYKETIASGTESAAAGGYTTVCAMPNLRPVPDGADTLAQQLEAIEKDALVEVIPYGSITVGEQGGQLSDMEAMADKVIGFSDDGKGVQSDEMMEQAMLRAKALDRPIVAHCEDERLLHGGYIHDGVYAAGHGHKGISSESEWAQLERDLELVRRTGVRYHMCHLSTKESLELIRRAKAEGLDVTCETGPHYLTLCDEDLQEDGRFRMNPPLRAAADRDALVQGMLDGTIDMIATDHAPHSAEEKSGGLAGSLFGVVGLETAFPVMYTNFVKTGIMSLEQLIGLMSVRPAQRFGAGCALPIGEGRPADLTVFDLGCEYTIDPEQFRSAGRATPFAGEKVFGRCIMTMVKGKKVWQSK
ncbi:MAG: dihydroorotase [Ruminococcaceae bacterium]|nr:dihydroorotase [Oscillospiraceae bacterium]